MIIIILLFFQKANDYLFKVMQLLLNNFPHYISYTFAF